MRYLYITLGFILAAGFSVSASTLVRTDGYSQMSLGKNNILTNGLLNLYSFDAADVLSTTVYDRSGQGNNATVTNRFSTTTTPYPGKIGQAFYFADSTEVFSNANSSITGTASRTISIWTYQDTVIDSTAMALGVPTAGNLFAILCYGGNWYFNGWSADLDTLVPCTTGEWHHSAVTYNGTMVTYFLDGASIATSTIVLNTTAAPVKVGTSNGGVADWAGGLDDARVYNRVLSQAEITELYLISRPAVIR